MRLLFRLPHTLTTRKINAYALAQKRAAMEAEQASTLQQLSSSQYTCEISNPTILSSIIDLPNKNTILNEANYGLKYINQYLGNLQPQSRVLEIGSGPCILISQLSYSFPAHSFTGIEPIGPGFNIFRESLNKLKSNFNFELFEMGYEEFENKTDEKYDLIFLINVFEHLPNWKDFLRFVKSHLKPNGRCVILCPNYSFPYESHFKVPIIFNKLLTFNIFQKKIEKFENTESSNGLWESLNFVKLRQVIKQANNLDLLLTINNQITSDLINRLTTDYEFAKRQKFIGKLAKIVQKTGFLKLFDKYPIYLLQPYMYLEIFLKPTQQPLSTLQDGRQCSVV
jgi:SAM-dependent methyltransferase